MVVHLLSTIHSASSAAIAVPESTCAAPQVHTQKSRGARAVNSGAASASSLTCGCGCICTHRAHTGHAESIHRVHTGHAESTHRVHTGHAESIHRAHTGHAESTHRAHTGHAESTQSTHRARGEHTQSTHRACREHTPALAVRRQSKCFVPWLVKANWGQMSGAPYKTHVCQPDCAPNDQEAKSTAGCAPNERQKLNSTWQSTDSCTRVRTESVL